MWYYTYVYIHHTHLIDLFLRFFLLCFSSVQFVSKSGVLYENRLRFNNNNYIEKEKSLSSVKFGSLITLMRID